MTIIIKHCYTFYNYYYSLVIYQWKVFISFFCSVVSTWRGYLNAFKLIKDYTYCLQFYILQYYILYFYEICKYFILIVGRHTFLQISGHDRSQTVRESLQYSTHCKMFTITASYTRYIYNITIFTPRWKSSIVHTHTHLSHELTLFRWL